jgi:hypothetical protein
MQRSAVSKGQVLTLADSRWIKAAHSRGRAAADRVRAILRLDSGEDRVMPQLLDRPAGSP